MAEQASIPLRPINLCRSFSVARPMIMASFRLTWPASSGYLTEAENALNASCFVVLDQGYYPALWAVVSSGTTLGQEAVSDTQLSIIRNNAQTS